MRTVQERRLPEGDAEAVVECIDGPRPGSEWIAKLLETRALRRKAATEFRDARREIERPRPAKKIVSGPAALHPEALQRRISRPQSHLMARPFHNLNQHPHGGIARCRRWDGIDQHDVDGTEDPHSVEIALRLIQRFLLKKMTGTHGRHAADGTSIDFA